MKQSPWLHDLNDVSEVVELDKCEDELPKGVPQFIRAVMKLIQDSPTTMLTDLKSLAVLSGNIIGSEADDRQELMTLVGFFTSAVIANANGHFLAKLEEQKNAKK